jgi:hypothetical protein
MSTTIIPVEDASTLGPFFFTVDLDGVNYQFNLTPNEREDFWYLDVLDIDDNVIRQGVKVVSNWPLLRLVMDTPRPEGEVITIDTRYAPLDPGLDDFGIEVLLGYEEVATLP